MLQRLGTPSLRGSSRRPRPSRPTRPRRAHWEAGKNYFLGRSAAADRDRRQGRGARGVLVCVPALRAFPAVCRAAQAEPAGRRRVHLHAGGVQPEWEPYARAYYTAESLGVLDKTHQALFDALHRDHLPMRTIDDLADFYAQHGVDKAKFLATSGSFEVESKLSRAAQIVKADGVDGTPSIVVNGKYRVTGASAGGYPQLIELVDWLVKKEIAAKRNPRRRRNRSRRRPARHAARACRRGRLRPLRAPLASPP